MEVTYIDHMGSDGRVVNAARVSFHKEIDENILSGNDEGLIRYLAKHEHFTPFTHVQITMREKVPIFVARQRFKHTVGFSYNEVSRRYVDERPEFFLPEAWRKRAENKKQGSSDEEIKELTGKDGLTIDINFRYQFLMDECEKVYNEMIDNGVAPEQARMVLPQSMYTEYYVTGSLSAWARAYKLRSDAHAQAEIQELSRMWMEKISLIKELEHSWSALTKP